MGVRTLKIGLDAKLYRNTGTVAVPIFDLIPQLKDAELGLEKDSADASSRASTWRKFIGTLKNLSNPPFAGIIKDCLGVVVPRVTSPVARSNN